MSGICGYIDFTGNMIDQSLFQKMVLVSKHLGIDGIGYCYHQNIALSQLAFLPNKALNSAGFPYQTRNIMVTANMRLDNKPYLLNHLYKKGFIQHQQINDSQIIAAAWQCWQQNITLYLEGDFSLAIVDIEKNSVFLARDCLGSCSLYYYYNQKMLIFASEIAQILQHPTLADTQLNQAKIADHLIAINSSAQETFYQHIFACPPAHSMQITATAKTKYRYWDINPDHSIHYSCDQEYTEHFTYLLNQSIKNRSYDSPQLSISLSGGKDSTLLAAMTAQHLKSTFDTQLKSYSYVFDVLSQCDERAYIQAVVQHCQLDAEFLNADELWPLNRQYEWPTSRDHLWLNIYTLLPQTIMYKAQQAKHTILFGGQFGDALFSSSSYWITAMLKQRQWQALGRSLLTHGLTQQDMITLGKQFLPNFVIKYHQRRKNTLSQRNPTLHPKFVMRTDLQSRFDKYHLPHRDFTPAQNLCYQGLLNNLWPEDFTEAKRWHYQYGIQHEAPYRDQQLIEYIMAIPSNQLGYPWQERYLQINAMHQYLPPIVYQRTTKTSFYTLFEKGLRDKEQQQLLDCLKHPIVTELEMINPNWLQAKLRHPEAWDRGDLSMIWIIFCLELWLKTFHTTHTSHQ